MTLDALAHSLDIHPAALSVHQPTFAAIDARYDVVSSGATPEAQALRLIEPRFLAARTSKAICSRSTIPTPCC